MIEDVRTFCTEFNVLRFFDPESTRQSRIERPIPWAVNSTGAQIPERAIGGPSECGGIEL